MRILVASFILLFPALIAQAEQNRFSYSTGGVLRLPNSQLETDRDNVFFEGWFKASVKILDSPRGELFLAFRAKYITDSAGYSFNNHTTLGIELGYKLRLGKRAALTTKLRHDWNRRADGSRRDGLRFFADYFFLDYKVPKRDSRMLGLQKKSRIVTAYATLSFPETLLTGDDNVTLTGGASYNVNLTIPDSPFRLTPYAALYAAVDEAGLSYNNKLQPSFGIKLKYPLPNGDAHIGLRYQGDYRWKNQRFDHGPSIFIGWYSSF